MNNDDEEAVTPAASPLSPPSSPLSPAATALAQRWKQEAQALREQQQTQAHTQDVKREEGSNSADHIKAKKDSGASVEAKDKKKLNNSEVNDEDESPADEDEKDQDDPFEDKIDVLGTWEYLDQASDKLVEYLDRMADAFSYSGQGVGLSNLNVRSAWNRCIKFRSTVRERKLDEAIDRLKEVKTKLFDEELGTMSEELRKEAETFLKGHSYVLRELKEFRKNLQHLSPADREAAEELVREALAEAEPVPNATPQLQVAKRGSTALIALDTLRARLILELSIARRVLLHKAAKYGCIIPGLKDRFSFQLAQDALQVADEEDKFKHIFAPDPPPEDPGFIIRYPSPRNRAFENRESTYQQKVRAFRATTDARAAWRLHSQHIDEKLHLQEISEVLADSRAQSYMANIPVNEENATSASIYKEALML